MQDHRDISDAGLFQDMLPEVDFAKGNGIVPVIVQDHQNGEVLMLAYMNEDALSATLITGQAYYFSRSKNRIWKKGETSGHEQNVHEVRIDCDNDTILLKVEQTGAACHAGYRSCFYRENEGFENWKVVEERVFDPATVYKKEGDA